MGLWLAASLPPLICVLTVIWILSCGVASVPHDGAGETAPYLYRSEIADEGRHQAVGSNRAQSSAFVVWCAPVPNVNEPADAPQTFSILLSAAERGDADAASALFAALYAELHRLARRELARRGTSATLGVTTLLHEAYLDIANREGRSFPDRPRFMAYASRVMRGVIIDHARRRQAIKRGGGFELTTLDTAVNNEFAEERDLTQISDALDVLSQEEPSLAEVVDLKFFCGFSFPEIAALRGVSERTVQRQWEKARLFLYRTLRADSVG